MAVYKIPQDVEADDKFVGPLSFKQFIFIGIAAVAGYLSFLSLSRGFWPALIFTVPIITVGGFLGFPWGRDQPTEIWLAARIRFFIKPRVRIWNQSGVKELVTVTVPKKVEKHYTDGLSLNEVQNRLSGLATLIDSRGWAIKNQDSPYQSPIATAAQDDDRLLDVATLPRQVSESVHAVDILDESTSGTAMNFDAMIKQSEQKHRQELIQNMQAAIGNAAQPQAAAPQQGADFWFLNGANGQASGQTGATPVASAQQQSNQKQQVQDPIQPAFTTFAPATAVTPQTAGTNSAPTAAPVLQENTSTAQLTQADEQELLNKIHASQQSPLQQYGHLKTIAPLDTTAPVASQPTVPTSAPQQAPLAQPQNTMTAPVDPAILKLASNDDLNIDTIARQANMQANNSGDEVVISLR